VRAPTRTDFPTLDQSWKSHTLFYRKPIKNNKMVCPEGLNGAAQAFDLPIMRSKERVDLGSKPKKAQGISQASWAGKPKPNLCRT